MVDLLSSRRRIIDSGSENWSEFLERRRERLIQMKRPRGGAEKVSECIIEDLLTNVLDWSLSDINYQMCNCDVILTKTGIKHLLIETKYPGQFSSESEIEKAFSQAFAYAKKNNIKKVAISDGRRLFLTELCLKTNHKTGWIDISLDSPRFPEELWYFSVHGIYRSIPGDVPVPSHSIVDDNTVLHHKYKLPSWCFAYVGDNCDTKTWKLPYLREDGSVDSTRLPKAISAVISNYRGERVKEIPEVAISNVLRKLEGAARKAGKMPDQDPRAAPTYVGFADVLLQMDSGV